jgi:cellobiose-specific phosphotransferase system component IIB
MNHIIRHNTKKIKDKIKESSCFLSVIMLAIGASGTITNYEGAQFTTDYQTAICHADQVIEDRHGLLAISEEKSKNETAEADVVLDDQTGDNLQSEVEEWKTIIVTTYNPEIGQTDADPYTMANGEKVYEGAIASNCYPIGTKLKLVGFGEFTVADRMNRKFTQYCGTDNERADIFVWDRSNNGKWVNVPLIVMS